MNQKQIEGISQSTKELIALELQKH